GARRKIWREVYLRYRAPLDVMLGAHYLRASVHFLVNMLEAYYFADPAAVRRALCGMIKDNRAWPGEGLDVEEIGHPKNVLKAIAPGFDEQTWGADHRAARPRDRARPARDVRVAARAGGVVPDEDRAAAERPLLPEP